MQFLDVIHSKCEGIKSRLQSFFLHPFFVKKQGIIILWIFAACVGSLMKYFTDSYNNYKIFKGVFIHLIQHKNLYVVYPQEYFDVNHYGPFFSLVIAPFALLPDCLGMILWNVSLAAFLIYAILQLPVSENKKVAILWICLNEFITAALSFQFNTAIAAILVLAYVYIQQQQNIKSILGILLGTFVKLYGVVGLAFFLFVKDKMKFIALFLLLGVLFFLSPVLLSSFSFMATSYADWFIELAHKNETNIVLGNMQDISAMGLVRRIFNMPNVSNLPFLLCGIALFATQFLNLKLYSNIPNQLLLLASTLLFTVLFSSGSESPTYIIAFVGVAIWAVVEEVWHNKLLFCLFLFAFILTSLSPTDIFPKAIRFAYVQKYSLKALPCLLIWLHIVWRITLGQNKKTLAI